MGINEIDKQTYTHLKLGVHHENGWTTGEDAAFLFFGVSFWEDDENFLEVPAIYPLVN